MKKLLIAGAFVAAAFAGTGVANAAEVQVVDANGVPVAFETQEACQADGPQIALADAAADAQYPFFICRTGDDGRWYLFNSDSA